MSNKQTIWSSKINLEEWKPFIKEEVQETLMPNYEKAHSKKYEGTVDDFINEFFDECYQCAKTYNDDISFRDELERFNINTNGNLVCISSDRRYDYNGFNLSEYKNLSFILERRKNTEYYIQKDGEEVNIYSADISVTGTEVILYRELKPNLNREEITELQDAIYRGECTHEILDKYTLPIGQYVQKEYGIPLVEIENEAPEKTD